MDGLLTAIPYLISGGAMIAGHYIPWESTEILKDDVRNRLFCYTWGVSWVILSLAVLAEINHRAWVTILEIFLLFATAGLATGLCYLVDWLREVKGRERRRAMSNER